jgi:predicted nucleotidyltransferase
LRLALNLNNRIQQVLAQHGGIRMAILFGSLARARETPQSDLDLAVLKDAPLSGEAKMALIGELSQAIGRPVDLIDLCTAGEPLLGQILKHGIRLMGSDGDYAELLKRHLFEEADFMPYRRRILAERRRAWIEK